MLLKLCFSYQKRIYNKNAYPSVFSRFYIEYRMYLDKNLKTLL